LEKIKIENSRVLSKYLEIKEENGEIVEKINELSLYFSWNSFIKTIYSRKTNRRGLPDESRLMESIQFFKICYKKLTFFLIFSSKKPPKKNLLLKTRFFH